MKTIQKDVVLAPYTTFKIGGPAKFFVSVSSTEEIQEALLWAREKEVPVFLLGGGSNILISDQGFQGLVIHLEESPPQVEGNVIRAFSGTMLGSVVERARDASLSGMQNLAGVPGSLGGAVRGNAGAFGVEMKDIVSSVEAIERNTLEIQQFSNQECHFSYRMSVFKNREDWVVTEAQCTLVPGKKEDITQVMQETIQQRNDRQDQTAKCAGSFFMNPVVNNESLRKEFEDEAGSPCRENKIPAGWLIDKVGLRGKRIGDAMVSESHPNYILNVGEATAEQVIMLMSYIKQHVRHECEVQLMQEVQFVGFE